MRVFGVEEAAVHEFMCVGIHYSFVPSYTFEGAWLLLGVRLSNVEKARPSTHSQKLLQRL